jgi:hypothetical protein
MASDVRKVDIQDVLERHHVHYEVRPYYVVLYQRPAGAEPVERRIQAGFDVDLYGTPQTLQMPLYGGEEARKVMGHFESVAREIQSTVGQHCTVEIIPYSDSLILDTQHHFRPEAMCRIRISHCRGLDQPEGPAEEQALEAVRKTLRELQITEA